MIRLLVDGVFFQLNSTGIARVWRTVLTLMAQEGRLAVHLLDRGGAPDIDGINRIPFRPYDEARGSAEDSQAIQEVCDRFGIDVFTSSYYTTPLSTPMLLVVYDMIPELFAYDLRHRPWMEKQIAISFSQRFLCISEKTRTDLLAVYPEIPASRAVTAYCGVDVETFRERSREEIEAFRAKYALHRDYFLFVGSRGPRGNYKNSWLFFEALQHAGERAFDILCVGGEAEIEPAVLDMLPDDVTCRRVGLSDDELATAYGDAVALIYPSLYEGFGMPVVEAMASGCPVITTNHGSLAEAAGDAALLVGGQSVDEMRAALARIRDPDVQRSLRERGLRQARNFCWSNMARQLEKELLKLAEESRGERFRHFFDEWRALRLAQAQCDRSS